MEFIKPKRLQLGDTIAILSPSWGGPSVFPYIYEQGLKNIVNLGFKVKEYPSARADAKFIHDNPQYRAEDLNSAFADSEVKGIILSIGGDDSIRILRYLDQALIRSNPKLLMGYRDTAILTTFLNRLGLVTFNGPSIMSGYSQIESLPQQ